MALKCLVGDRKQNLLFLHAITGCDIPSALYRQGKKMDISVYLCPIMRYLATK